MKPLRCSLGNAALCANTPSGVQPGLPLWCSARASRPGLSLDCRPVHDLLPELMSLARTPLRGAALLTVLAVLFASPAQAQLLPPVLPTLDGLPRPSTPPPEKGPVVPARVERWRQEAKALEYGDGVPRDPVRAAELYCRAARHGDAEAQYSLAWMMTNSRGIERNDAQAAHLFAAAKD